MTDEMNTTRVEEDLEERLRRLGSKVQADEEERRHLVCYGLAPGDGAAKCEERGAHQGCRFLGWADCPRSAAIAEHERTVHNLSVGEVPRRFSERLTRELPNYRPQSVVETAVTVQPLRSTEALTTVRSFVARTPLLVGGHRLLEGVEDLLVLAGGPGCGKTLAAAWAIGRFGGLFVAASQLGDPRFDANEAERARLLVIDDAGTEYAGPSGYAAHRIAELLILRHAERRRSIVTTNLDRARFGAHYGDRLDDRLEESGAYRNLTSSTLRGAR
jgi:hypothetical protein